MHYYQFNIGDYAKRTRHLSNLEDLAYRRLMDLYYSDESPIIADVKKVARIISMRDNSEEVGSVLSDFFTLEGGHWRNSRIDKELCIYAQKADTARANGKLGGRPKKPTQNPEETKQVMDRNPEITGSKANQEPRTINQEPLTKKQSKFIPPTVDQVKAYCLERNNGIDPVKFVNHYQAVDWMRGKNKIKNWKSCVITWEGNQTQSANQQGSYQPVPFPKYEEG